MGLSSYVEGDIPGEVTVDLVQLQPCPNRWRRPKAAMAIGAQLSSGFDSPLSQPRAMVVCLVPKSVIDCPGDLENVKLADGGSCGPREAIAS